MKTAKLLHRFIAGFLAVALALTLGAGFPAVKAYAASGSVYTCTITPCYAHPVTGTIEDSGGASAYTTGQAMVESCIYTTGILEVTDSGEYYLTFRMSLMDYTSNHSFWVQEVGASSWSSPAIGQTGSGTDSNGTTADICVQVPSENCVVRFSMYVEPMGRSVVAYFYPSNYSSGNSTSLTATIVTSSSSDSSSSTSGSSSSSSTSGSSSSTSGSSSSTSSSSLSSSSTLSSSSSLTSSSDDEDTTEDEETEEDAEEEETTLSSSITEAATVSTDDELDSAEGLSLSTASETEEETASTSSGATEAKLIVYRSIAATVSGLILMGVGAVLVYVFRKNWYHWGGEDDDYDDEDGDDE